MGLGSRDSDSPTMRCTICASEFTEAQVGDAQACPTCGDSGLPMAIEDDVSIAVNWHELRILGMWAERWAAQHKDQDSGAQRTVAAICGRLRAQYPERTALTISGEIAELRQAFHSQVEVEGFDEDEEANDAAA